MKIPKVPKKTKDGSNVDPTKTPEPKVNPQEWQYKPKFVQPSWELIKRVDTISLVIVFEMFYGEGQISGDDLSNLIITDTPRQSAFDVFALFTRGMVQGYFGDIVGRYGELRGGCFVDSKGGYTPIYSCPLPTKKVFSYIQEKDIVGLLEPRGYEIQPGLQELIKYFSLKEKPDPELVSQPQAVLTKDSPENSFEPDGQDNWRITFKGENLGLVKSSDGMRYISLILNKEKPIPSDQLYRFCEKPKQDIKRDQIQETIGGGQGTVDWDTINDLKRAKQVLTEEIDEIKSGDYLGNKELGEELTKKEYQIKEIRDYLNKNTRPDKNTGKIKLTEFASEARKASNKIHHALNTAYKNIQKESPELADYLKSTIKSENNQFSYNPPQDNIIFWDTTSK